MESGDLEGRMDTRYNIDDFSTSICSSLGRRRFGERTLCFALILGISRKVISMVQASLIIPFTQWNTSPAVEFFTGTLRFQVRQLAKCSFTFYAFNSKSRRNMIQHVKVIR